MFRKVLQRSFPILVAALVLISATALPAQAVFYEDDGQNDLFYSPLGACTFHYDFNNDYQFDVAFPREYVLESAELYCVTDELYLRDFVSVVDDAPLQLPSHSFVHHNYQFPFDAMEAWTWESLSISFDDFVLAYNSLEFYCDSLYNIYIPADYECDINLTYYYVGDDGRISEPVEFNRFYAYGGFYVNLFDTLASQLPNDVWEGDNCLIFFSYAEIFMTATLECTEFASTVSVERTLSSNPLLYWSPASFFTDNGICYNPVEYVTGPSNGMDFAAFLSNGLGGFFDAELFGYFGFGDVLRILITIMVVLYILRIVK